MSKIVLDRIIHEIRPSDLRHMGASRRAWRYASSSELPCHMMLLETGIIKLDVREGVFRFAEKEEFLEALDRLGAEMEAYEREHNVDLGPRLSGDPIFDEYWYGVPP